MNMKGFITSSFPIGKSFRSLVPLIS
jgi:hypothetical protein